MTTRTDEERAVIAALVEWDWLDCRTSSGRLATVLHHASVGLDEDEVATFEPFTATCGRAMRSGGIPGMFTRMGRPRCRRCCAALGYPPGVGSPKNDQQCRPLVEARLAGMTTATEDS